MPRPSILRRYSIRTNPLGPVFHKAQQENIAQQIAHAKEAYGTTKRIEKQDKNINSAPKAT